MIPAYSTEPLSRGLMATAGTWGTCRSRGGRSPSLGEAGGPLMVSILTVPRALGSPTKTLCLASRRGTGRTRQIRRLLGARLEGVGAHVVLDTTQHSAGLWIARGKGNGAGPCHPTPRKAGHTNRACQHGDEMIRGELELRSRASREPQNQVSQNVLPAFQALPKSPPSALLEGLGSKGTQGTALPSVGFWSGREVAS